MSETDFGFPKGFHSFFLGQISEPAANELKLVVLEGAAQGPVVDVEGIPCRSVLPAEDQKAWVLHWETYFSYAVTDESFAAEEIEPPLHGDRLVERFSSAFLDFVEASTFASTVHPGKLRHFLLICENHLVDVVSTDPPTVVQNVIDPSTLMDVGNVRVWQRVKD